MRANDAAQKARWEAMIDEATVDCYDEYEESSGMLATREDHPEFPFQIRLLGGTLEALRWLQTSSLLDARW